MNFTVYKKETIYFWIMAVLSIQVVIVSFGILCVVLPILIYKLLSTYNVFVLAFVFIMNSLVCWLFYFVFRMLPQLFAAGQIRGNGIKVNEAQFPDIFSIVKMQSACLGMNMIPDVYIMQEGGLLNICVRKLAGTRYVILSSQLLAVAYEEGRCVVEFVIARELARIQRRRMLKFKSIFIWPARLIPFLGKAYARSCEHTYDAMAHVLCPEGAEKGITLFAAGYGLYNHVKTHEFILQKKGFALWFFEIWFSTPQLIRRLQHMRQLNTMNMLLECPIIPSTVVADQFTAEKKQQSDKEISQAIHSLFERSQDTKEL